MPGGLNPREYDLGELRDAVRETGRDSDRPGRDPERAPPRSGSGSEAGAGSGSAEPPEAAASRPREPGTGADARSDARPNPSAFDDPEAYLRSRRRGGSARTERSHENRQGSQNRPNRQDRQDRQSRQNRQGGQNRQAHRDGQNRQTRRTERRQPDRRGPPARPGRRDDFLPRDADASKPYLEDLPGGYGAQSEIFEWLDLLVSRGGHDGAVSALEYYESIEWLSAESRTQLEAFVGGLAEPGSGSGSSGGSLGVSDHRESLRYVARLAGRD